MNRHHVDNKQVSRAQKNNTATKNMHDLLSRSGYHAAHIFVTQRQQSNNSAIQISLDRLRH
jgi:hypothetical protein